jgi:glutamyl-tRNA synthetase
MSTVTVRFAPSPTGRLHVGNARVALINWLLAKAQSGRFILRIDDTDAERSKKEHEEAIEADLRWLGLDWDAKANQSERFAVYDAAAAKLRAEGRLYACYETAEELDYKRKRQMARGAPPVYDRAALKLTQSDLEKLADEGRRPHWRFKLDETAEVAWHDLVRGPCHYHASHLSDPVLIREDGTPLYTLPSVVDDAEMNVTHVIRGEDHVTNTAAQIQLFQALGAPPPNFAHLPLLTGADGQGLSKRLGSLSLGDLRRQGLEAMALNSLLAGLGSSNTIGAVTELGNLVRTFDIGHFGRSTPKFDPEELLRLNAKLLHDLPLDAVADRLQALGIDADEPFWLAVRGNLDMLSDAEAWWKICRQPLAPVIEDAAFAQEAGALLPEEPWTADTWKNWTQAVQTATGRKGRPLFHPLRLALTGREDGPELKTLLPLIGRARALARLQGQTA